MCRACYLTGHTEEIAEFYDIGTEIDTYRNAKELVDKTRFYLDHPNEAERLRQSGYERARRDHTWQERFKELFEKTGLPVSSSMQ
jgi:spore maturation protein CgeB